jgi:hypothetical protein
MPGTSLRVSMRVKVGLPAQVTGILVESRDPLSADDELVTLQFGVAAPQGGQEVQVVTQVTIRGVNVSPTSGAQAEVFTYGF